jgi:HAD superfamily phosphoserine phosphatase-like hydrolase
MSAKQWRNQSIIVLTDFDGTIVDIDTGAFALEQFASGDWQALDREMVNGRLTFEECLRRQFRMINAPIASILARIDQAISLRPHFIEFVDYCRRRHIKLIIVSGGLDFYIRHFLRKNNLNVEIRAPKCDLEKDGLNLQFPPTSDVSAFSFKDDLVRQYRRRGNTVGYVGDGLSDYYALKLADLRFAIVGSISARLCRTNHLKVTEVLDFLPVIEELGRFLDQEEISHERTRNNI